MSLLKEATKDKNVHIGVALLTGSLALAAFNAAKSPEVPDDLKQPSIGQNYVNNPSTMPKERVLYLAQPGDTAETIADNLGAEDKRKVSGYINDQDGSQLDTAEVIALDINDLSKYQYVTGETPQPGEAAFVEPIDQK